MQSSWLDPLLGAQRKHRYSHRPTTQLLPHAPDEPDAAMEAMDGEVASSDWAKRSKRGWDMLDSDADFEEVSGPTEILPEIEREIGIAEWIDPETGEPPEGHSPPHLEIE